METRLPGATHSQFLTEMGLEHSDSDLLSGLVYYSELLVITHSNLIVKIYEKFLCSCFYLNMRLQGMNGHELIIIRYIYLLGC